MFIFAMLAGSVMFWFFLQLMQSHVQRPH